MVLARLPRLRSGADPRRLRRHVPRGRGRRAARRRVRAGSAGQLPDVIPFEVYCHSLTDPSILGPVERATGHHTLTLFGLHTPAELFRDDPVGTRREAVRRAVAQLDAHLAEPLAGLPGRATPRAPCLQAAPRWTWRRPWPCPAGTSSTATCPGRSPRAGAGGHLGRRDGPPADRRRLLGRDGPGRCGQRAGWLRGRPAPARPKLSRGAAQPPGGQSSRSGIPGRSADSPACWGCRVTPAVRGRFRMGAGSGTGTGPGWAPRNPSRC